ncbi:MAG: hypothetical protein IK117_12425 [Bacteroidales bacterium]|nr:hypothetical protein [Bacteroidales bacterium]
MTEEITKHALVDDYPYLVYTDKVNNVYINNGFGELPIATANKLGCIRVGSGLSVNDEGIVYISGTGNDDEVIVTDGELGKSFNELLEMLRSGRKPYIFEEYHNGSDYYVNRFELGQLQYNEGTYFAVFSNLTRGGQISQVAFYSSSPITNMILD